jgi:hypothetical protein
MTANSVVKSTRNETLATLVKLRRRHLSKKRLKKTMANILQDTGSHGRDSNHTPLPYRFASLGIVTSVPHLPLIRLNFSLTTKEAAEIRVL